MNTLNTQKAKLSVTKRDIVNDRITLNILRLNKLDIFATAQIHCHNFTVCA